MDDTTIMFLEPYQYVEYCGDDIIIIGKTENGRHMKNKTGGAWPIGAEVVVWGYNTPHQLDIIDCDIVQIARGRLLSIKTISKQTIDGYEPYTAAIVIQDDGHLFAAEIEMVQIIEKQDMGAMSYRKGLIARIFDFVRMAAK